MMHCSTATMVVAFLVQPYALWQATQNHKKLSEQALVSVVNRQVTAVNAVAQALGVKPGMPLEGARAKTSKLVLIDTPEPQLETSWERLLAELYSWTPRLENPARGLAFLELSAREALGLAQDYQARVGVATTREEAHLLALSAGQAEAVLERARLSQLPLRYLENLGLSSATLLRLDWLGVRTWGQLQTWTKEQLRRFLGQEYLLIKPYLYPRQGRLSCYEPARVLRASYSLESAVVEPAAIMPVIDLLCAQLLEQLGKQAGSRLRLSVLAESLVFSATQEAKLPLNNLKSLQLQARQALQQTSVLGLELEALELEIAGLYQPAQQPQLWQVKDDYRRAIRYVGKRFPQALFYFEEVNPYLPNSEFAFKKSRFTGDYERHHQRQEAPQGRKTLCLERS